MIYPMGVLRERDRLEGDLVIEVAFTGVGLDVSDHAPAATRDAVLTEIARECHATPVLMHQVHGAQVAVVEDAQPGAVPSVDAVVTTRPGTALLARAADCVPVLLADRRSGVIAAVHAGRQGLVSNVVGAAVRRMGELGSDDQDVVAWVGPHVCGACYEVPESLQADVVAEVPQALATTSWGTTALDLGSGVRAQLAAEGVGEVRSLDICTREDPRWPSYRRDGAAATRFAGVIWRSA